VCCRQFRDVLKVFLFSLHIRKARSEKKMKKLELIALFTLTVLVEISTPVSLYTIISDAEHVAHDNRLPKKLQPVEVMVDSTNHLGLKILELHSNSNKNNIAFSPCGLMSVLVALFEGSSGRSTIELKEALEFPNERDIVRVGVRDIHRRLRVS
jgi:serine protease inhibitor